MFQDEYYYSFFQDQGYPGSLTHQERQLQSIKQRKFFQINRRSFYFLIYKIFFLYTLLLKSKPSSYDMHECSAWKKFN